MWRFVDELSSRCFCFQFFCQHARATGDDAGCARLGRSFKQHELRIINGAVAKVDGTKSHDVKCNEMSNVVREIDSLPRELTRIIDYCGRSHVLDVYKRNLSEFRAKAVEFQKEIGCHAGSSAQAAKSRSRAGATQRAKLKPCEKHSSPDEVIAICTARIASGSDEQHDLANDFYVRGHAYDDNEQNDLAIADYGRAMQASPNDPDIRWYYLFRAFDLRHKHEWDAAISDFTRIIGSSRAPPPTAIAERHMA